MTDFGARLVDRIDAAGPLCVGIDPHEALLRQWGLLPDAEGLARFCDACVEAFAGTVAVVKPQVAFFEAHGSAGFAVLERTISALRAAGTLVIADAKRGDIGSTMAGYAHAWLSSESPLASDAVTVSPYLGFGALGPVLDAAAQHAGGVFVLAATSNPEGRQVQSARGAQGRTVSQLIVDDAARRNRGVQPLGSVGVVVGATLGEAPDLSELNGPVLMPGLGAQGGTAADLVRLVGGGNERGILPSVSRSVLAAGPGRAELRAAIGRTLDTLSGLTGPTS